MTTDGIRKITQENKEYPNLLKQIADPPEVLYYRGNIDLLSTPCIGVVGTRKLTPYGRESASYITRDLAINGMTIVSGLAIGIDTIAHQTALDHKKPTIAVLGCGVDDESIYPPPNVQLAAHIIEAGGLVISEYEPGTRVQVWTFPRRNRIVSGLSKGVVIIEADKESGALITARCALDQNRDVFAVPGNIFSPRSVGPNWLIQNGAKLVLSGKDILDDYAIEFAGSAQTVSTHNPVQEKILAILKSNGPTHIDTIIKESLIETSKISANVSLMEINGQIKHLGSGTYQLCN